MKRGHCPGTAKITKKAVATLLTCCLPPFTCVVRAQTTPLTLHYYDRPPFFYSEPGKAPKGILIERTEQILRAAKIPFQWTKTPVTRILHLLQTSNPNDCSPGWYYVKEREQFAQYSLPIYRDLPLIAVYRTQDTTLTTSSGRILLNQPGIRLLLKRGLVPGQEFQAMMQENKQLQFEYTVAEAETMLNMLENNRADLAILTQEEITYFIQTGKWVPRNARPVSLSDLHAVDYRHILCGKKLAPAIVSRMNEAIKNLSNALPPGPQ